MLGIHTQLAMSVYRKRTSRQNDCFNVDGIDFNYVEVRVATHHLVHVFDHENKDE